MKNVQAENSAQQTIMRVMARPFARINDQEEKTNQGGAQESDSEKTGEKKGLTSRRAEAFVKRKPRVTEAA